MKRKTDRKAREKIDEIQAKFGGLRPELITMYLAEKLNCLTKALIGLTVILGILTCVHIVLLIG